MDILIVEDSASLRYMLQAELQALGHRCHLASSGEECLHLIESDASPDYGLVLMDVDMPGLNGFETTRLLRETLPDVWVPVIFLTGRSDELSFAEGIESGGDDYLTKPPKMVILAAKITALERIADMQRELKRLNRELELMSVKDGLTQLNNRRAFDTLSEQAWQEAIKRNSSCGVIILDVDFFKQYNDAYGHLEGDHCLVTVARVLENTVKDTQGILARYGGEEFIILCPGYSFTTIVDLSETLRENVQLAAIEHASSEIDDVVTVSIGVSISNHVANITLQELISAADKQLYRAKRAGRNQVAVDELDSHKTILIGMSHANDLRALSDMLSDRFNLVTTDSGKECLEIANYIVPDLIVACPNLTDENGILVSSSFKYHDSLIDIPVLSVAEQCHSVTDVGRQMGINGFLTKPFDRGLVNQTIARFINPPRYKN